MSPFRVLIVDDHGVVRMGIRALLDGQEDMVVVGEATNGEEALEMVAQLRPALVLMDITMPGISGIEATRIIKEKYPETQILILTMHDDDEFFYPVLKAGASGYILKEADPQELLYAIRLVHQDQVFLSPAVVKSILNDYLSSATEPEDESYHTLTPREREVFQLIAKGKTNREMAETLFLSIRTVEKHRQSVMNKLGFSKRGELTKYALRKGIIDSDI